MSYGSDEAMGIHDLVIAGGAFFFFGISGAGGVGGGEASGGGAAVRSLQDPNSMIGVDLDQLRVMVPDEMSEPPMAPSRGVSYGQRFLGEKQGASTPTETRITRILFTRSPT